MGKTIGILNKGKNNVFVGNTFHGLDIGILDEGEDTRASDNKFSTNNKKHWSNKWWVKNLFFPLIVALAAGIVILYTGFKLGWNGSSAIKDEKSTISQNIQVPKPQEIDNLRPLQTLETGKKIGELPNDVFFFASPISVQYEISDKSKDFLSVSNKDFDYYFEIQKIDNRYYLIGFISDEAYSKIGSIHENSIYTMLFPISWGGANKPVAIPFDSVYAVKIRTVDLDENKSMDIFDIGFKEVIDKPIIHKKLNS